MTREATNELHRMMDDGEIDPRAVADAALRFLSEDDVRDMAHNEEILLKQNFPTDGTDITEEFDCEYTLADVFDTYTYEHGFDIRHSFEPGCEDAGINYIAEVIADEGFTTIKECIDYFCKCE